MSGIREQRQNLKVDLLHAAQIVFCSFMVIKVYVYSKCCTLALKSQVTWKVIK